MNISSNSERQRMKGPLISDSDCDTYCLRWQDEWRQDEWVNDSTMTGWMKQQNWWIQMKPGRHEWNWQRRRWTLPCFFLIFPPQSKILGKLQWHNLETGWMTTFYIHVYIFTHLYIWSTFCMNYIVAAHKLLAPRGQQSSIAVNGLRPLSYKTWFSHTLSSISCICLTCGSLTLGKRSSVIYTANVLCPDLRSTVHLTSHWQHISSLSETTHAHNLLGKTWNCQQRLLMQSLSLLLILKGFEWTLDHKY